MLRGLDDIDYAVGASLGLFRITERTRIHGEVRRGFGGHDGWMADAGLDGILRSTTERLVPTAGPRVHLGDTAFIDACFGVTPEAGAD